MPVTLPTVFEQIAKEYGGQVIRTRASVQALMEAANRPEVILAADRGGSFIWPEFQPVVDGMMTIAKLIEFSATLGDLSDAISAVPEYHMTEGVADCPWDSKGTVMRLLNQQYKGRLGKQIDGVKIELGDGEWVLLLPDPDRPLFQILAQASSDEQASELVQRYERIVQSLQS